MDGNTLIDKLPPSWTDFKHTLKHGKDDLSLIQLGSHLRIEESLRTQDSDKGKGKEVDGPSLNMIKEDIDKGKGKEVGGPSVNMTEEGICRSGKKNTQKAGGRGKGLGTYPKNQVDAILRGGSYSGFGYYNNGMFMLNLNKVPDDSDSVYMSYSSTVVNSSLWHARIIHETTAPYTPRQNGVAERKNRDLKEMVNSMLSYSGLSEGFWEEAMLTACYLLNRVPNKSNKTTPYELWYKKQPNLSFLLVWGCRAVVRLPDLKQKTLGEKGIDCIFVGYVEHSKAYRFYVIEPNDSVSINSIIESRDAIFDENHFSSIPRPNDIIPNAQESQLDDHTDDVPSEIPEPRKGKRVQKAKSYSSDFQLYLVEGSRDQVGSQYSYCFSIEEDPRTYNEAMQSRDAAFWKEAIDDEIGSIMENNTWILSNLPLGCKPLGCKWIFKRKMKVDGRKEYIISIPMHQLLVSLLLDCYWP
ncbi:zinc finger, CCHC-type containing protein [Tanacetum coccineum]